ncbi:MAG TPA: 1,4-alpha-glucan branching enzyme, partial [Rhodanobacteraceae bacterium]|nr:1,4-alpha-glucan branching enzyme [Rhodanobacteraceae bacterium]
MDRLDASIAGPAESVQALIAGRLSDPFALLGPHREACGRVVRVFAPGALAVRVAASDNDDAEMLSLVAAPGYFAGKVDIEGAYRVRIAWPEAETETADAYAFGPILTADDLAALREGRHPHFADALGAHAEVRDGVAGVRFAVWAPNARRVSVVGDFNA